MHVHGFARARRIQGHADVPNLAYDNVDVGCRLGKTVGGNHHMVGAGQKPVHAKFSLAVGRRNPAEGGPGGMNHHASAGYTRIRGIMNLAAKSAIRILWVRNTRKANQQQQQARQKGGLKMPRRSANAENRNPGNHRFHLAK